LWRTAALCAAEIHYYDDVAYLDELKHPSIHLKILHRTPIMSSRDQSGVLGYLVPGTAVEVLGLGETQYYVTARITTRLVKGWVDAEAVEKPPAELVEKFHTYLEKARAHGELIARHEVVVAMTRAEVQASLGKPDRISRVHTPERDAEQWLYTIYKYLPHYAQSHDETGQLRQVVSYRREATGHKVITFQYDKVTETAEEQDDKAHPPAVIFVPPAPAVP
jgi:hypothetical protein